MMNISMNMPMQEAAIKNVVQAGKSSVQSMTSKQTGSFGEVFSQLGKQLNTSPKVETSENPSLLEVLSFTEREDIANFLSNFMQEEDVADLLEIVDNVPFMYQLEDVVEHLLENVPVLKEWMSQLFEGKGQPEEAFEAFMQQVTHLFQKQELTLTKEQVSLFATLQPIIQEVLVKSDQTPKLSNWLHQLQIVEEQKELNPMQLLKLVQLEPSRQSPLSAMSKFAPSNGSQSIQAILQQMNAESNETSQTKVEGVTSTALSSKDTAGEVVTQRFQLNLEQTPEAKRGEKLMQELQAMMKRANFGRAGGVNRITVQVYPEQLGQIRIELQENKGILTARILASVAMTKDLLERQMNQLRQALGQHTQVERIEIVQMLQETPRHEREQLFQQQQRQFQQQQAKKENKDDDEQTFEEFLAQLEEVELNE